MLKTLQFDITAPTSYRFLERFRKLSSVANDDKIFFFAQYLQEIALLDASLLIPLDDGAGDDEGDVDDDEEEREEAEGDLLHEVPQGQVPDVLHGATPGWRAARV